MGNTYMHVTPNMHHGYNRTPLIPHNTMITLTLYRSVSSSSSCALVTSSTAGAPNIGCCRYSNSPTSSKA